MRGRAWVVGGVLLLWASAAGADEEDEPHPDAVRTGNEGADTPGHTEPDDSGTDTDEDDEDAHDDADVPPAPVAPTATVREGLHLQGSFGLSDCTGGDCTNGDERR